MITPTNTVPLHAAGVPARQRSRPTRSAPCSIRSAPTAARRSLASPQIMVLDNEKAEIKVGKRISVQTQAQTGVRDGHRRAEQLPVPRDRRPPRRHSAHQFRRHGDPRDQPGSERADLDPDRRQPEPGHRHAKRQDQRRRRLGRIDRAGRASSRRPCTTGSSGVPLLSKIPVFGALFGSQNMHATAPSWC